VPGTEQPTDHGRWSVGYTGVFQHTPTRKHYRLNWSRGATECQDESPFEYTDPDPVEVEQREVTAIQWVPVA
jgi:hypothetical protein